MNHGGIGYMRRDGLFLPVDTIRPLGVRQGARLYCLYYPSKHSGGQTIDPEIKHDFLITPVPPRFWSSSVRLTIRLKHVPGTAITIARHIRDDGWTILNAEGTRSGYRYVTWNLVISDTNLSQPCVPSFASTQEDTVAKVAQRAEALVAGLIQNCSQPLFFGDGAGREIDTNLSHAIDFQPITALAHFHAMSCLAQKNDVNRGIYWAPVEMKAEHDGYIRLGDDFAKLIDRLAPDLLPRDTDMVTCFLEMDLDSVNLRVTPLPQRLAERFVRINVKYVRRGGVSSRGLLSAVMQPLAEVVNIYRTSNYFSEDDIDIEKGEYQFIGKLTALKESDSRADAEQALNTVVTHLKSNPALAEVAIDEAQRTFEMAKVSGSLLSDVKTRHYLRALHNKPSLSTPYDVFFSHRKVNADIVRGIRDEMRGYGIQCAMDEDNVKAGEDIEDEVVKLIYESREFLVYVTTELLRSPDSKWVHFEIGVAAALGKPIRFLYTAEDSRVLGLLPDYLKKRQGTTYDKRQKLYDEICSAVDEDLF